MTAATCSAQSARPGACCLATARPPTGRRAITSWTSIPASASHPKMGRPVARGQRSGKPLSPLIEAALDKRAKATRCCSSTLLKKRANMTMRAERVFPVRFVGCLAGVQISHLSRRIAAFPGPGGTGSNAGRNSIPRDRCGANRAWTKLDQPNARPLPLSTGRSFPC